MKKPFHKHVIHHVKRAHRTITKYLYERDTIFATLWVFVFIFGLALIPINFKFLNPLKLALKDFDFNDLAYAKLKKAAHESLEKNIVIVNIGMADREGLAMLIEKASSYGPKAIGLDVWMEEPKEPEKDSLLASVIRKTPNLIMASRFKPGKGDEESGYHHNYFTQFTGAEEGSVNFLNEEYATIRLWNAYFKHKEKGKTFEYPSFALALIKKFNPGEYEKFRKKGKDKVVINYRRRIDQYRLIEPEFLLADQVDSSYIRGKIVLLGYINTDPTNIEDKKFTPMNEKYYGKTVPDMNGIVVHANIISMVLEHNYIKKLPLWFMWLFAIFIGWLHMSFFIRYYLESHIWFHLVAKIAQLASAIFFVFLGVYLFDRYRIKLDMKITLVVIVLAVDVIYFYEAWAVWMHKKFGYKTVFHHHQH